MVDNTKVRIHTKSLLQVVAAILSLIAAASTLIGKWAIFSRFEFFSLVIGVIIPIFPFLLFAVFTLLLAKKHIKLMLIPILLICSQHLLNEFFIYERILHNYLSGSYDKMTRNIGFILTALSGLFILIALIICAMTFFGLIKSKLLFIALCVINIIISIALEFIIVFWYIIPEALFLCAFILLAAGMTYNMNQIPQYYQEQPYMNQQNQQLLYQGQQYMYQQNQQFPYYNQQLSKQEDIATTQQDIQTKFQQNDISQSIDN